MVRHNLILELVFRGLPLGRHRITDRLPCHQGQDGIQGQEGNDIAKELVELEPVREVLFVLVAIRLPLLQGAGYDLIQAGMTVVEYVSNWKVNGSYAKREGISLWLCLFNIP